MAKEPRVTVLMPVYNGGAFLRPAIDSVLAQTFRDFELLIIDDGSTDGSLESIEVERDSRIRLVHNHENLGLVATLNRGVELVKGTYLARMDADDLCEPRRFERQVEYLDRHPEVGVCSTWATFINSEGLETGVLKRPIGKDLQRLFWKPSPLVHAAMMGRTALLKEHPYDPDFADSEDYELFLRLYNVTQIHNLPEALYRIRRHGSNVSITKRKSQLYNSYRAFCCFLGHEEISYEVFLALSFVDFSMNPLQRFRASVRASRRTGVNIATLVSDNWKYFRKKY
jgi:glycosyltransferase involved in cell wall biosynthesis